MNKSPATEGQWRRVRNVIYLRAFLSACMPIWPVYALMFNERSGLSTASISQLFLIWSAVSLVSELPTGVLADRYSRRLLLAGGTALEAVTYLIWLFEPTYTGYAIGFIVWGVAWSMSSGCLEAYLYDELQGLGESKRYTAIFTRAGSMKYAGMVAGFTTAALLGAQRYSLLLSLSIGFGLLATVITLRLPREPIQHHEEFIPGTKTLRTALSEVKNSPVLKLLVAAGALTGGLLGAVEEYVPLYYKLVGVPVKWIPHLLVVGLVFSLALSWFASRFERLPGWFAAAMLSMGAALLLVGIQGGVVLAVVAMLVFKRIIGLSLLLYQAALQHAIEGTTRATVSSLPAFLAEFVAICIFAGYWVTTSVSDDMMSIRLIAGAALVTGLALLVGHRLVRLPAPVGAKD